MKFQQGKRMEFLEFPGFPENPGFDHFPEFFEFQGTPQFLRCPSFCSNVEVFPESPITPEFDIILHGFI